MITEGGEDMSKTQFEFLEFDEEKSRVLDVLELSNLCRGALEVS